MTVEEAKRRFGSNEHDGYVYCSNCPIGKSNEDEPLQPYCTHHYKGKEDCHKAIVNWFRDHPEWKEEEHDPVNHPSHYTTGMECIEEIITVFGKEVAAHFCLGNVWKYRKRALHKNGLEDLDKSDWYMNKYWELMYDGE